MKIQVHKLDDPFRMEATYSGDNSIIMDTYKAIDLSLEKYGSVAKTPRSYAKLHYTFEAIP
jgi:hypothetical protein